MRYLNTVYVHSHRTRLQCRRGCILISSPDGSRRIPLEAVDAVVVMGSPQITMQALDACTRKGIRVAALTKGGAIRFTVHGATSGNVHLRTALFEAAMNEDRSLMLARVVVAAKLQNSASVVGRWSRDEQDTVRRKDLVQRAQGIRSRITKLADVRSGDGVRGIEGDAARIYFRAMSRAVENSHLTFSTRTRRPPRDSINAMLSFCYGLLVTEIIGAIESVGLDYQIGFFHRPRSGRPSLALDLAEELRALTDRFVITLVRRRQVTNDDFEHTPGGAVYLNSGGRSKLINAWEQHKNTEIPHQLLGKSVGRWAIPSIQATLLARHLRGDLPDYPPFVLS